MKKMKLNASIRNTRKDLQSQMISSALNSQRVFSQSLLLDPVECLCYPKPHFAGFSKCDRGAVPGFPVNFVGAAELHAAFPNESRTRGCLLAPRAGNPGRLVIFGAGTPWRTWGTRPVPSDLAMTQDGGHQGFASFSSEKDVLPCAG
jgi:hypothetical protein